VQKQVSEKGSAKQSYNMLFFQELNIVNLPSEKVYLSGRLRLWPVFTCIPNLPLLRYIDILELRQTIEKQLNKGENANKFSRAMSFGHNQEFLYGEKVEQEMAEGCRRLIKNAIICWNYLYRTQKIAEADSEAHRQALLVAVRHGSVVTWQHINLHGEYDCSDEKLHDSVGLSAPRILAMSGL
jgi:Tn3 transposase DDE domain